MAVRQRHMLRSFSSVATSHDAICAISTLPLSLSHRSLVSSISLPTSTAARRRPPQNADADVRTVLVANKYDLEGDAKKVAYEQGEEMAKQYGMPFFETSAKTNHNVEMAFEALAREVIEYTKLSGGSSAPATPGVELNGDNTAAAKGGCCK